ncbi:MAG TPA: methyltransferase domain-containing protein [Kofleriaceae bacterium]|nr:methyltransferase domain-containing protein [Kofleriaceae bacterium]
MATAGDYVLGTHDAEIERLELQHEVWRAQAREAWRRAGIGPGQTVIDVGCGPGLATVDLAELVGAAGRVIALDRSPRFLEAAARRCEARGIGNVAARVCDLDVDELLEARAGAGAGADAAWARWVFSFVGRPRELLQRVARALRSGGVFVAHEYFDYGAWRAAPRDPAIEEFVAHVMASWRARGGEPDIALELLGWLPELGFEIASVRPIVEVAGARSPHRVWLQRFAEVGLQRLVELGEVTAARGAELAAAWEACTARPGAYMVTPAVLEIVAVRR